MQARVVNSDMARYTLRRRGGYLMAIRTKDDREYVARLNSFRAAIGSLRLSEGTSALLAERNAEREGRTSPGQWQDSSPNVTRRSTAKPSAVIRKTAAKASAKKALVAPTQTGPKVAPAMKTSGSRTHKRQASAKKP